MKNVFLRLVVLLALLAPAFALAGTTAWVGNKGSDSISIIDVVDDEVLFNVKPMCTTCIPGQICSPQVFVPCINGPHDIDFSPDGHYAFITAFDGDKLVILDASTLQDDPATAPVLAWVGNAGDRPQGVVVSPDGYQVYVANSSSDNVQVFDTYQGSALSMGTVTVGDDPDGIAVTPDGSRILVTNNGTHSVSEIDTAGFTVTITLDLDDAQAPRRIVIGDVPLSGGGTELRAYTVNANTDDVTVIDASASPITLDALSPNPIALDSDQTPNSRPRGMALTPDNEALYVTEYQSSQLTKIRTVDNFAFTPLNLEYTPHRIAIEPDGAKAYIANPEDAQVSIVNLDNNNVTTLAVQNTPGSVAILVQPQE